MTIVVTDASQKDVMKLARDGRLALREKRITPGESGRLMKHYEEALEGSTYLSVSP